MRSENNTPTMSGANRGAANGEKAWFHFWFSTFGTWLRGDVRGFRDHDHRIHSSGDYKQPPPRSEHAGLRRWVVEHMHKDPVRLTPRQRERACGRMKEELKLKGVELLVIAVADDHAHGLGKFPVAEIRKLVGHAKRGSSHALREQILGAVWGKKCQFKQIRSRKQQIDTFKYIQRHARQGAAIWTFRDGT